MNTKRKLIWIGSGIVSTLIFILLFPKSFPEASIEFKVSRTEILNIANKFAASLGYDISGYRNAVSFASYSDSAIYLEKTIGIEHANNLIKKTVPVWFWTVRYFKPLQKEEIKITVKPTGEIHGLWHYLEETAAGEKISQKEAKNIAQRFLIEHNISLKQYKLMDSSTTKEKNRTDHYFEWEDKNFKVGEATLRRGIEIQGDKIGNSGFWLKVPEKFKREYQKERSRANLISYVSYVFSIAFYISLFIVFLVKFRAYQTKLIFGLFFGVPVFILYLASGLNSLSLIKTGYNTAIELWNYYTQTIVRYFIIAGEIGLIVYILVVTGEAIYREMFGKDIFGDRKSWADSIIIGYSLAGIFLGYQAVFYYLGGKIGVWSPLETKYSNIMSTAIPWIYPLTVGLQAALSEEFLYRVFTVTILKKWLKKNWLAIIIPAVVWALGHSSYLVSPIYVRGIELSIVGIFWGWIFLKYGVLTLLISHYSIDAFWVGLPLLRSESFYFQLTGLLTIAIGLLPLVLLRWKKYE